jgi:hypothetical protein
MVAHERASVTKTKLLVLFDGFLIHVLQIKSLAGKPMAEVANDAKAAPGALPAMSFLQ